MFGYNHSIAYCLIGYICAYLRYYYPYEFITCYLNNASNEEDIKQGTELAEIYGIKITAPKYGASRENYYFNKEMNVIAKGLASIKYISSKTALALAEIYELKHPETFIELLCEAKNYRSDIDARQLDALVKIDFFDCFGNIRELSRIRDVFEFFKGGDAKSIKKTLVKDDILREIIESKSESKKKDGSDALSYSFKSPNDVMICMLESEKHILSLGISDLDLKTKIQNSIDVLGYVDVATGKPEDRKRLLITELAPLTDARSGSIWSYRVSTRSLGSGKNARVSIRADLFDKHPIKAGDIIYVNDLYKNNKGYWYLSDYRKEY